MKTLLATVLLASSSLLGCAAAGADEECPGDADCNHTPLFDGKEKSVAR